MLLCPQVEPSLAATEAPAGDEAGGTRVLAFVGATPRVAIHWTRKAEGARGLMALASVHAEQEVHVHEGLTRTVTRLVYDISRDALSSLRVQVPEGERILGVEDVNVREWTVEQEDGHQLIDIQLFEPAQGTQRITLEMERHDSADLVTAPVVRALDASRQEGVVAVALGQGLRGEVVRRDGLMQLDARELPLTLTGRLGAPGPLLQVPLPHIEVLGAVAQEGAMAVLTDPGFDVRLGELSGIDPVLHQRLHGWLGAAQRELTRQALEWRQPGYGGWVELFPIEPDVLADTITNVRVTDRAVEETTLIDLEIRHSGLRRVSFVLPSYMEDAAIQVPLLREKTVEPLPGSDEVLVTLVLQDEVMQQLRVLVSDTRLLTDGELQVRLPRKRPSRVTELFSITTE